MIVEFPIDRRKSYNDRIQEIFTFSKLSLQLVVTILSYLIFSLLLRRSARPKEKPVGFGQSGLGGIVDGAHVGVNFKRGNVNKFVHSQPDRGLEQILCTLDVD